MVKYILSPFAQLVRGTGSLEHVGEHPGTAFFILMVTMGGLAGLQGGDLVGLITGASAMFVLIGSMYAYGAISRARLNDRLSRQQDLQALFNDWISTAQNISPTDILHLQIKLDPKEGAKAYIDASGKDIPLPNWLQVALNDILTRPRTGLVSHCFGENDIPKIALTRTDMSAHDQMAALHRLTQLQNS